MQRKMVDSTRRGKYPAAMFRSAAIRAPAAIRALLSWLLVLGAACATYRDDLDRSMQHYNAREYEQALALLEVLEKDIDSLSVAERAQYSYYRGMSHFLLDQRFHARHWLGLAAAREKTDVGSLHPDEKKKVEDTLAELNKRVYGGSDVPAVDRQKCNVDTDCVKGQFCDNGEDGDCPSSQKCVGDTCKRP
jgi:hypothetical protein